jgi:ABC-2 type transport system permease protein
VTAYLTFEVRRLLHNRRFLIITYALPVGLYLLNMQVSSGDDKQHSGLLLLAMMCTLAVCSAAMSSGGMRLALERTSGWARQLRITPLPREAWLGTKLATAIGLALPGAIAVMIVATRDGTALDLATAGKLLGVLVLGALPLAAIGMTIGFAFDQETAQGVMFGTFMVLGFLGGIFVPVFLLPDALQVVSKVLPSYHLIELARGAIGDQPVWWGNAVALLGWLVVFGATTLWLRNRDETQGAL